MYNSKAGCPPLQSILVTFCVFSDQAVLIQSRFKATESMLVWAEGKNCIFSGASTLVDQVHATHMQKCSIHQVNMGC